MLGHLSLEVFYTGPHFNEPPSQNAATQIMMGVP